MIELTGTLPSFGFSTIILSGFEVYFFISSFQGSFEPFLFSSFFHTPLDTTLTPFSFFRNFVEPLMRTVFLKE